MSESGGKQRGGGIPPTAGSDTDHPAGLRETPHAMQRDLADYRNYLMTIAHLHLEPHLYAKLDASDIVQQTLLEAHEQREQFCGSAPAEFAGWLRQMLIHNLLDVVRSFRRERRDIARERSLDAAFDRSTASLAAAIVADQSSPSFKVERDERGLRLADVLQQLPESQREALVLQYWHGWTVAQIADHLGRTRSAAAGLLKRGLLKLREELGAELEELD